MPNDHVVTANKDVQRESDFHTRSSRGLRTSSIAAIAGASGVFEITVNPKLFDGYVGRYQLAPNFVLSITRGGDHLFAQATGQPKFELFAEGEKEYF